MTLRNIGILRNLGAALLASTSVALAGGLASGQDVDPAVMEFVTAWQQAQTESDPERQIALIEDSIEAAESFGKWPFQDPPRDAMMGQMWGQLGVELQNLPAGDREASLERSIDAFDHALSHFSEEAYPREWAMAQRGRGVAYRDRIAGDPEANKEEAIAALRQAQTVLTRSAAPDMWADIEVSLSHTYRRRIAGSRAENLELAVAAAENAIGALTRGQGDWGDAQNARGAAYFERINGERADNVEEAIASYESALSTFARKSDPEGWAGLQDNLGMAYAERVRGDAAENRQASIAAFENAAGVYTRQDFPRDWAQLQMNLGNAYTAHTGDIPAADIAAAIEAYESALTVFTPADYPELSARTSLNLATVLDHPQRGGDLVENKRAAIDAYNAALEYYSPQNEPERWAITQRNLGIALLAIDDGTSRFPQAAAAAFESALTVHTLDAFPLEHLRSARQAGIAASRLGDWTAADRAFASAIEASTLMFGQGLNEAESAFVVSEGGGLFAEAAYAAAELGDPSRALVLADQGKSRLLGVALGLDALGLDEDDRRELNGLRGEIRTTERELDATEGEDRQAVLDRLIALRRDVREIIAAQKARRPDADPLAGLLEEGEALAAPVVTFDGAKLLVATLDGGAPAVDAIDLPAVSRERLDELFSGSDGAGGWFGAYAITYASPAEQSARYGEWLDAIEGLGQQLSDLFGVALVRALAERSVPDGARLYWAPQGALGAVPIGLMTDPASGEPLAARFEIVVTPSLAALSTAEERAAAAGAPRLAAIVNPTEDLAFTVPEGAAVASHFGDDARAVLTGPAATPDAVLAALREASYWHFSSHGRFDWDKPRESGLYLAGRTPLTIGRLLDEVRLGSPRLVVLSACETGLYDVEHSPDEFIGLPATFLELGAAGVIGTLWPVADASTALLVAKFYSLHLDEGLSPPAALRDAQLWLRDATRSDLTSFLAAERAAGRLSAGDQAMLGSAAAETGSERPFEHPLHWAGFVFQGA